MKIHPQDDLILVEFKERKKITPQGIHIPQNAQSGRDLIFAEVIEVGQGQAGMSAAGPSRIPHTVKPKDIVLMSGGASCFPVDYGNIFKIKSKNMPKLALVPRESIMATVELEEGEMLSNPIDIASDVPALAGMNGVQS